MGPESLPRIERSRVSGADAICGTTRLCPNNLAAALQFVRGHNAVDAVGSDLLYGVLSAPHLRFLDYACPICPTPFESAQDLLFYKVAGAIQEV